MSDAAAVKRAPRSKAEQRAETLEQILDAAEYLFAENGLAGVTLRDVAQRVGVHTTLMHYYFKNKQSLFEQVFARRAGVTSGRRMEALDRYEAEAGDRPTVEGALHAFLDTDLDLYIEGGEPWKNYGAFGARISNTPEGAELMDEHFDPVVLRLMSILKRALPDCPEADVFWGYHFVTGALMNTLARTGRIDRLSGGLCRSDDYEAVKARMAAFMAAGFTHLDQRRPERGPEPEAGTSNTCGGIGGAYSPTFQFQAWPPCARRRHTTASLSANMPGSRCVDGSLRRRESRALEAWGHASAALRGRRHRRRGQAHVPVPGEVPCGATAADHRLVQLEHAGLRIVGDLRRRPDREVGVVIAPGRPVRRAGGLRTTGLGEAGPVADHLRRQAPLLRRVADLGPERGRWRSSVPNTNGQLRWRGRRAARPRPPPGYPWSQQVQVGRLHRAAVCAADQPLGRPAIEGVTRRLQHALARVGARGGACR